jgi:TonB-linked SusC/RagA family outer membrane protein
MGHSWAKGVRSFLALCTVHLSLYLCAFAESDQGKKKVTLIAEGMPRQEVFKRIEKQTGLSFFYSSEDIKLPDRYTIRAVDKTLDEVLGKLLLGYDLEWEYNENVVVIRTKRNVVTENVSAVDSSITSIAVSGKVTDANGQPIPGATVRIKRNNDGGTTNIDGNFSITNVRKNDILLISSIGYETRELPATRSSLLVKLNLAVNSLDETVIKGYYSTTQRLNTGTVSKVSGREISRQTVSNPIIALQGRVPGLYISQSSGISGSSITVRLRGRNSLRSDANEPLYIIDGVPFSSTSLTNSSIGGGAAFISPFSSINPADIESIEVLKDADATAIYGSRGANGVILITTKKGMGGRTTVNINVNTGISRITRKMKLLNTKEYLEMRHEALSNDGVTSPSAEDYDINGAWDSTRYTDWQKQLIGGSSTITNAQVSISGGSATTDFIAGGAFYKEGSVFPGDFSDTKVSGFANLTHRSTDGRFKMDLTARYLNDNNVIPTTDFTAQINLAPNAPALYDPHGRINWENNTWNNPIAPSLQKSKSTTSNLNSNFALSYNIFDDLQLKVNFGFNSSAMNQSITTPLSSQNPSTTNNNPYLRLHTFGSSSRKTFITEPQLHYHKYFGKSKVNILIGATYQETNSESIAQTASGFSSDQLIDNIAAASFVTVSDNQQIKYKYSSVLGRIYYSYAEKYLFNLIGRREGSSRFGPASKFGTFSSLGVAWLLSRERFIQNNIKFISFAKLRGSYGTTGNDILPENQYLSSYSSLSIPYMGITGLFPTRLANPTLAWEVVKKFEVGLELGIFKDKLLLTTNYYLNRTSNQLVQYALPTMTGFSSIQANLPAKIQNTGLELSIDLNTIKDRNFSWTTSGNITIPRNKLLSYPNLKGSSYANLYEEGKSLYIQRRIHYLEVDKKTGLYTFQDVNEDGKITTPQDLQSYKEIRQNFFGGLQNSLAYQGFELSFLIQFVKQTGRTFTTWFNAPGFFNSNQPDIVMNRWTKAGDNTSIQRFTQTFGAAGSAYSRAKSNSDFFIDDASFIRLKNVYFSYDLPLRWQSKIKTKSLKIYMQCQNLLTFTNYLGLDPETQGASLPPLRSISAGVQIAF